MGTVNRQDLVDRLELASLALADNNMVQILQCFMFTGTKLTAMDGTVGISISCKTDQAFAVHGKTLLGLLTNSGGDEVTFETFLTEGSEVVVKTGRSKFKLPIMDQAAFVESGGQGEAQLVLPIDDRLLKGLEACMMTSSRDATKAKLWGVLIKRDKTIKLYSCDGDALTRHDTKRKTDLGPDIMLPLKFCEAVVKIAKVTGLGKQASLTINDDWAHAKITGGYDVLGHLMQVEDPINYADTIKRVLRGTPTFLDIPDGLNEALTRAQVITKNETAKTVLTVTDGKLKLFTQNQIGVVRDSVMFPEHPDVQADVNAELVQRSMAICDKMAITDRCAACQSGDDLLQIVSHVSK